MIFSIISRGQAGGNLEQGEDLFLVIGESNAEGRGNSASSTNVTEGQAFEWNSSNVKIHLDDPVGGASTGSFMPAFGASYFAASGGRKAVVIEAAKGSTVLTTTANATANMNWSATGTLYSDSITKCDAAIAGLPVIRPRGIIINLGVNDASFMDANRATYTKAVVKAAFANLIDRYKTKYPNTPFYIIKTWRLNGGYTISCQEMRDIQQELADEYSHVYIAFNDTDTFTTGNGKMNGDNVHYSQAALNEIGLAIGVFIAINQ